MLSYFGMMRLRKNTQANLMHSETNPKTVSRTIITVYCEDCSAFENTARVLEAKGLDQGEDFVAIDTVEFEMRRMNHSDEIEQSFWFETGADWLKYKHWNGKVLVWYDG